MDSTMDINNIKDSITATIIIQISIILIRIITTIEIIIIIIILKRIFITIIIKTIKTLRSGISMKTVR